MTKAKTVKAVKIVISVILSVLMAISVVCAIVLNQVDYFIDNYDTVPARIIDSDYCDTVYREIYSELNNQMSMIVIKPDDLTDTLTRQEIAKESETAMKTMLSTVFASQAVEWEYRSDALNDKVSELLQAYADEHNIEYEPGSDTSVYDLICTTITGCMKVIPDAYALKLASVAAKAERIAGYWYLFVILYIVLAAVILIMGRKTVKNAFYNIALPSYIGAFIVFAASAILYGKKYLEETVLSNPIMQLFIQRTYDMFLYDIRNISLIVTLNFVVLSVIAVVIVSIKNKNKEQELST